MYVMPLLALYLILYTNDLYLINNLSGKCKYWSDLIYMLLVFIVNLFIFWIGWLRQIYWDTDSS